jgi:hypothetical protein
MPVNLTSLAFVLRRCEEQPAVVSRLTAEEIALARWCVEAIIDVRPALAEVLRSLEP